jgi:dienelactone hydrolase
MGLLGSYSDRAGPFPAVVVLHGCSGISSHSAKIADQLASWGYLALTVDSLGPRGMTSHCGGGWFSDQTFDAYAALRYLAQLDFVDPTRVAVLGQSMGGAAALYIAGDRDPVVKFPGMSRHIADLPKFVPRLCGTIMLPGCGHLTQEERPAEVNAAIMDFIRHLS